MEKVLRITMNTQAGGHMMEFILSHKKKQGLMIFAGVLSLLMVGCATCRHGHSQPKSIVKGIDAVVKTVSSEYALGLEFALYRARKNTQELINALNAVEGEEREALVFLISEMPVRDLVALKADFLVENVRLAHQSLERVPWGKDIPRDVFLNDILPYVNMNERRDRWRPDFYERYIDTALEKGTIRDTVLYLNQKAFEDFGVTYHGTKRPKPDQSPFETIEGGYASCTGLSIFISDVLRAVGIPARVAGTPLWVDKSGNHTWVEVWDNGRWYHIGAAEPGEYNDVWFNDIAAQADASDPSHRIYAVSFKRTGMLFPTIWDPLVDYVYAQDVTERYK